MGLDKWRAIFGARVTGLAVSGFAG
jgi:hypothetical protein